MLISSSDVQAPAFDELGPIEYLIVLFGSGQVAAGAFVELLDRRRDVAGSVEGTRATEQRRCVEWG
jgi:hypothetical protein